MGSNVFLSMIASCYPWYQSLWAILPTSDMALSGVPPQRRPWDGELMTSSHLYR